MENIREHLYLAALLHDIGKFYQRASNRLLENGNNLSPTSKEIAGYICPLNQSGHFGYQHTIWTAEFLSKHEDLFKKVLGVTAAYEKNNENSLVRLSAYHHKPDSELSSLISMADWWSAGIDRYIPKNEDTEQTDTVVWGSDRYKKIPLYSIFNSINDGKTKIAFPLKPLDITDNVFPKMIGTEKDGENQANYKSLWDAFEAEFENLPTDSFKGFSESLLYLLKKYTWCIPSSTVDMANVSLFEHLKTTSAFADCLYLYKEEKSNDFSFDKTSGRMNIDNNAYPVLLLGGDLSGIQKFIYNIAYRKAAVSLKGRSFYLQLLIDSVIQRIISHEDIDVNIGNVVYSSGGKFYMLLPNTDKVKKAISELKTEFEEELWSNHFGQLIINIDYIPFAYCSNSKEIRLDNEIGKTIGDLWNCLANKLTEQKNQKFKSVIKDRFDTLFEPILFDKNVQVCAVTGIEANEGFNSNECVRLDDSDSPYVLNSVKWQTKLGQTLKDADYLLMENGDENNSYLIHKVKCNNISFGVNTYLLDSLPNVTSADYTLIKKINDTEFLKNLKGQRVAYGFQFYGGNRQAMKNKSEMKTFEDLVKKDNKIKGTYLGILRMDVDNLGTIFIKGLPEEQKSFASYATLSFMLDYFFSGYINTVRNSDKFKDDVNILYSGGDDVFAIGRWDKLIEFAHELREKFEKFVGRSDISISGGIAIVGENFPIAKAAELAGEAEHNAKQFDGKNAFNIFGKNIAWKNEYDYVGKWKNDFVRHCGLDPHSYKKIEGIKPMPRSILHKIMTFAELKQEYEEYLKLKKEGRPLSISEEHKKDGVRYAWHTVYYLKRFKERFDEKKPKEKEIRDFCDELQKEALGNTRNYDLMSIAARWAELILKEFE